MAAAAFASALVALVATPRDAAAQDCRFTKSLGTNATLCVCERGGRWRIVPDEICRRGAAPVRPSSRPAAAAPAPARPVLSEADRIEAAKIQWALNAVGCDAGAVDGLAGPKTRAATRCLQRQAGQSETGSLSTPQKADLIEVYDMLAADQGVSGGPAAYAATATHPAYPPADALVAIMQGADAGDALAAAGPDPETERAARAAAEKVEAERAAAAARAADEARKAQEAADAEAARRAEMARIARAEAEKRAAETATPPANALAGGSEQKVALPVFGRSGTAPAPSASRDDATPVAPGGPAFADVPAFCQSQTSFYKDGAAPLCLIADLLAAQAEIRLGADGIANAAASCATSLAPLASLAGTIGAETPDAVAARAARSLDATDAAREDYIASMRLCAGLGYSGERSGEMALGAEIALLGLGAPGARETLGWRLAHGVGVARNDAAAAIWLASAADAYAAGGEGLAAIDREAPADQLRASADTIAAEGSDALLAFPPRD